MATLLNKFLTNSGRADKCLRGVLRSRPVRRIVAVDRGIGSPPLRAFFHQQGAVQAGGHVAAEAQRLQERQGEFFQVPADIGGGLGRHQAGAGRHLARHRGIPRRHRGVLVV